MCDWYMYLCVCSLTHAICVYIMPHNTDMHACSQDNQDLKLNKQVIGNVATHFMRTLPPKDMDSMLRTLARRPAGRSAILNSPTVVRALTHSKRQNDRTWRLRRGEELAQLAAKTAQAKGCATKSSIKLRRVEARSKGLQTMLAKVRVYSRKPSFIKGGGG